MEERTLKKLSSLYKSRWIYFFNININLFLFYFIFFLMSFHILSITDTTQLSELCTTLFQSIWITKRKQTTFKLFIQKVLKSTQLSCTCILVGLYYIQQLRFAYPSIHPPNGSEVRLLTTAFVLANKKKTNNI